MDQKLKQLEEAICEVIPEIRELKFGCKISIDGFRKQLILGTAETAWGSGYRCYEQLNKNSDNITTSPKEELEKEIKGYKIIGRDITLADCIIAIYDKTHYKTNKKEDERTAIRLVDKLVHTYWNLEKPLHEQSEECISFLHNIICN